MPTMPMPMMFADAYISSLGYLRPNVLFENNGERSERARTSAEGEKEKSPTTIPLRWRSTLRFTFYHPTDFEEKIEGLWTGYASIRKYAFPS